jgi:6-phosphogluconolactonase
MAVQGDGSVKLVANTHTEGTIPRSLALDPSGKFLYSMNQNADNLTTFRLDANGVPKFTGKFMAIGSPAVMVFLP